MDDDQPESAPPLAPPKFDPEAFAVPGELLPPEIKSRRAAAGLPTDGLSFLSCKTEARTTLSKRYLELNIAAFGNVDAHKDVMYKGCAERTIAEDGPRGEGLIKNFWNHTELLGPVVELTEHKDGILMVGQVDDSRDLDRYLKHAESGAAKHGSIGYSIVRASGTVIEGKTVRRLDEIKLWEGSLVIWPANTAAKLQAVKAALTLGVAVERKGFWEFAEAVDLMGRIQYCESRLSYLLSDEAADYARLDPEEAAKVADLLARMTEGQKSLSTRLEELKCRMAPPPTAKATNPEALKRLRAISASLDA